MTSTVSKRLVFPFGTQFTLSNFQKRGDEFADKDFGDKVKDTAKHAKEAVKEGWDK